MQMDESSEYSEPGSISDEMMWKKNSRFFYCLMLSQQLEWPSLSLEWLESMDESTLGYKTHRLAYATFTSSQDQEKLIIDAIGIPFDNIENNQIASMIKKNKFFSSMVTLNHQGESHRIRRHPSVTSIIASKSANGSIYIYNYSNESKRSVESVISNGKNEREKKTLQIVLSGHDLEGYGLDWNSFDNANNLIVSGSYDKKVCYWDYSRLDSRPVNFFVCHEEKVEDVAWTSQHQIASVDDGGCLILTDIRSGCHDKIKKIHEGSVNSFECSKVSGLWTSSSSDGFVKVWENRKLDKPLYALKHDFETLSARWAPFSDKFLAASTKDNKIFIWQVDADSPCFVHEGHFAGINDFAWNPFEQFVFASTDEDNVLQVWCMHPRFLN
jgi:WD40 repeat protein